MKDTITFEDFTKVDIRVGKIIEVIHFKKAIKPAYQLKIDFGDLGTKKSSAQITTLYSIADLLNQQVICVVNLKPKKIADFISECLILGIQDGKDVTLLKTGDIIRNGEVVS